NSPRSRRHNRQPSKQRGNHDELFRYSPVANGSRPRSRAGRWSDWHIYRSNSRSYWRASGRGLGLAAILTLIRFRLCFLGINPPRLFGHAHASPLHERLVGLSASPHLRGGLTNDLVYGHPLHTDSYRDVKDLSLDAARRHPG